MQDRVPLYPGRVMLTPVPGQENTFDMVRADSPTQEGTPLNKANLMKDATAAMFGLGDTAVPDEVLAWLGKYNLHWWARRYVSSYAAELGEAQSKYIINATSRTTARTITYADSIDVSSGEIVLVNPSTVSVAYSSDRSIINTTLKGKYLKNLAADPRNVYLYPSTSSGGSWYGSDDDSKYTVSIKVQAVSVIDEQTDKSWKYVQSSERNAYPDNGPSDDGYEYKYLDIPFDNSVSSPKIEIVEYTGTGTYGSSNPNTLTFSRVPEIVFFKDGGNGYGIRAYAWGDTQFAGLVGNANYYLIASVEGTTMAWYVGGTGSSVATADTQMNVSGKTYQAIALCS